MLLVSLVFLCCASGLGGLCLAGFGLGGFFLGFFGARFVVRVFGSFLPVGFDPWLSFSLSLSLFSCVFRGYSVSAGLLVWGSPGLWLAGFSSVWGPSGLVLWILGFRRVFVVFDSLVSHSSNLFRAAGPSFVGPGPGPWGGCCPSPFFWAFFFLFLFFFGCCPSSFYGRPFRFFPPPPVGRSLQKLDHKYWVPGGGGYGRKAET